MSSGEDDFVSAHTSHASPARATVAIADVVVDEDSAGSPAGRQGDRARSFPGLKASGRPSLRRLAA